MLQEPLEWHGVFFAVGIKARNCLELALRQVFSHLRFGALVLAPQIGAADAEIHLGEGHCFLRMIQPSRDLPVYHPLDGNVPRRRVGHLLLARGALARLNQLAVALLADDVRILAFVYVSRSYGHANGTFQFAQELNR